MREEFIVEVTYQLLRAKNGSKKDSVEIDDIVGIVIIDPLFKSDRELGTIRWICEKNRHGLVYFDSVEEKQTFQTQGISFNSHRWLDGELNVCIGDSYINCNPGQIRKYSLLRQGSESHNNFIAKAEKLLLYYYVDKQQTFKAKISNSITPKS